MTCDPFLAGGTNISLSLLITSPSGHRQCLPSGLTTKLQLFLYSTILSLASEFQSRFSLNMVFISIVRISPHYRGKNGSLVPIGHKGRFLPLENSKKRNDKW